ncbi:MAG: cation:proton antiporter [Verrucomicrobiales bacterium]
MARLVIHTVSNFQNSLSRTVSRMQKAIVWAIIAVVLSVACTGAYGQDDPAQASKLGTPAAEVLTHDATDHHVPFSPILLEIAIIIGLAVVGRWLATCLRQSEVLGELLIGVIVGNIGYWFGIPIFVLVMNLGDAIPLFSEVWLTGKAVSEAAEHVFSPEQLEAGGSAEHLLAIMTGLEGPRHVAMGFALWIFSELGVILLLFMVGLKCGVDDMLRVGTRALAVAAAGVAVPFAAGIIVAKLLLPMAGTPVQVFLAAALTATSVGVTARVLRDLNRLQTAEAQVILGAAVIDDILGLVILAAVIDVASTGQIDPIAIGRIVLLSCTFLGVLLVFGNRLVRLIIPLVSLLEKHNSKLLFPLALAFLMAWAANSIQLAPIVGAFAAGLILTEDQFAKQSPSVTMENLIAPLERIFAPIFFVLMGMQVNLQSYLELDTLWLTLAFTVVAILGKVLSGLLAGRGIDRLTVGIGMVPRGEVGLVFASIGKAMGIISGSVFSALVSMVIITTLVTPFALKWSLGRGSNHPQQHND